MREKTKRLALKAQYYSCVVLAAICLVGIFGGADRVLVLGGIFCLVLGAYEAKLDLLYTPTGDWDISELLGENIE